MSLPVSRTNSRLISSSSPATRHPLSYCRIYVRAGPTCPFVGTVPAIKPAAEKSRSHLITVLATPGTVARDYTQGLIREHASHCEVNLVGSQNLAAIAEAFMRGVAPVDDELVRELLPCFVEQDGARTDTIVLACTHYPLLLPHFLRLAGTQIGWPVEFIDPAPAIARRTDHLLSERASFTLNLRQERTEPRSSRAGARRMTPCVPPASVWPA